jgi:23S rRNA U2552 (ribose-2'-O)-methylase RlmE/FtsJ
MESDYPWKHGEWNAATVIATTVTTVTAAETVTESNTIFNPLIDTSVDAPWTYTMNEQELILHELRKKINKYESDSGCSDWEYFKKIVNPYELIYTQKKYPNFPESVCLLNPLSRSYFKLIEILGVAEFFTTYDKALRLRSAHVCEGPGGFIQAFLDLCYKHKITHYNSTAITLRPKQQNVPGWKRAAAFLRKNSNIKIVYGPDDTGNILNYANQNAFIEACVPKVHLFTGDGGFDFSMDYDSQEKIIFPLLLASVRIGVETLTIGGVFVLKFFDIYSEPTRDLIQFLSQLFTKWTLYKPATSRPCNPELYFVGRGFRPPPAAMLSTLRTWAYDVSQEKVPTRLFSKEIPRSLPFDTYIASVIATSVKKQISYLERVFALIETPDSGSQLQAIKDSLKLHEVISFQWCKEFTVPVYPERYRSIAALQTYLRASGLL